MQILLNLHFETFLFLFYYIYFLLAEMESFQKTKQKNNLRYENPKSLNKPPLLTDPFLIDFGLTKTYLYF